MKASSSHGIPNGEGRLLSKTGEIFAGSFVDGLKNGKGQTRLAGGTVYQSQWVMGKEIGGSRPDVLADARVGGLLKAQAGGGDADKVEIGVVVDQRMTQQSDMQYQHLVRDEDIAIYPEDESLQRCLERHRAGQHQPMSMTARTGRTRRPLPRST